MPLYAFVAPVLPGKTEEFRQFAEQLKTVQEAGLRGVAEECRLRPRDRVSAEDSHGRHGGCRSRVGEC